MKRSKKVSLRFAMLALLVAIPALVAGQTAPAGGGGDTGKPTPIPTIIPTPIPTATPVVENKDCDGGFKKFEFKFDHWDGTYHIRDFGFDDRDSCDHK